MTLHRIASYEILEPMGERHLFRARSGSGEIVAIKVLPPWKRSPESVARFQREIKVETAIEHENVARMIEAGSEMTSDAEFVISDQPEEILYFVREFVEGTSVEQILDGRRPPFALAISISLQTARGLGALHAADVIHRNLNPRNVLLRPDGVVKLVDFGLVKELSTEAESDGIFKTGAGQMIGTAGYMAPEQMMGRGLDKRSDLFSLGVILYELVSGRKPYPADDLLSHFRALETQDPTPLSEHVSSLPDHLDQIVATLIARDPEDRYDSALLVETELKRCLAHPDI